MNPMEKMDPQSHEWGYAGRSCLDLPLEKGSARQVLPLLSAVWSLKWGESASSLWD